MTHGLRISGLLGLFRITDMTLVAPLRLLDDPGPISQPEGKASEEMRIFRHFNYL